VDHRDIYDELASGVGGTGNVQHTIGATGGERFPMNDEEIISNNFAWFDGSMNYTGKKARAA
jgi:hypothetical protein